MKKVWEIVKHVLPFVEWYFCLRKEQARALIDHIDSVEEDISFAEERTGLAVTKKVKEKPPVYYEIKKNLEDK